MTAAARRAERQARGQCTRCPAQALTGESMCLECGDAQREHARRSAAFVRHLRRDNELCATCPAGVLTPSKTYRCPACQERLKLQRETLHE